MFNIANAINNEDELDAAVERLIMEGEAKDYLIKEHGDNIPVMKSIKRTLDPNNIMNPGKIFDLN